MTGIITFYSYKGGVGRTMALVNVAHVLARQGWRVLLVDFDLEAPGMTHVFADLVRDRPQSVQHDGLDLLLHAKRTLALAQAENKQPEIPNSLSEYVISVKLPDKWVEKAESGIPYRNGRLDFLPATLEPVEEKEVPEGAVTHDYLKRLDELDLPGIFAADGPRHRFGDLVRQYFLNARFTAPGDVLFTMRDPVQAAYDIVLIDSRTGLNEISGLCIGPLCDALVICLGLNRQNIYGTRYFMDKAGLLDRQKAKPFAVVAGPVPVWHTRQSEARVTLLRTALGAERIVEVPYHPTAALKEPVFVTQEPKDPISKAYEELAPVVVGLLGRESETDFVRRTLRVLEGSKSSGEEAWLDFGRGIANRLCLRRLGQRRERMIGPALGLASFPSAWTVGALPRRGSTAFHWPDVELVSLATALSAYRTKSELPFQRSWQLVRKRTEELEANDLAVRLLFFQLRVLGTQPSERLFAETLGWARAMLAPRERKSGYGVFLETTFLIDALLAAISLQRHGSSHPIVCPPETAEDRLKALLSEVPEFGRHLPERIFWSSIRRFAPGDILDYPRVFKPNVVLALTKPALEAPDRRTLGALVKGMRLPTRVQRMADAPGWLRHSLRFLSMIDETPFDMLGGEQPFPLGFWPEVTMASAVALVKGRQAAEEVVAWLKFARLRHGYAWRVLVDWRHLEQVKAHPAFVEFLRQEDQHVEAIESAIDRGEYPL